MILSLCSHFSPIKSFQIGSWRVCRCTPCQNTWIFKIIAFCQPERKLHFQMFNFPDYKPFAAPFFSPIPFTQDLAGASRPVRICQSWKTGLITYVHVESTNPKVWGNILTWNVRCRMVCRLKGMKLYVLEASMSVPLEVRLFCESNKWINICVTSIP